MPLTPKQMAAIVAKEQHAPVAPAMKKAPLLTPRKMPAMAFDKEFPKVHTSLVKHPI